MTALARAAARRHGDTGRVAFIGEEPDASALEPGPASNHQDRQRCGPLKKQTMPSFFLLKKEN